MRWLAIVTVLLLGPAVALPGAEPVSLLLKPTGVFDGVDGKVHPGWQVLVTGDRSPLSAPICPRLPAPP